MDELRFVVEVPQTTCQLTTLLMTHVLRCIPAPVYHALVCSSGSQGYNALKEMLQSGMPGNTVLLESVDVRDIIDEGNNDQDKEGVRDACHVFVVVGNDGHDVYFGEHYKPRSSHAVVYTDRTTLPDELLAYCDALTTVDLSNIPHGVVVGTGYSFFDQCCGLKTIDFSVLSKVDVIDNNFLCGCRGLLSIDLSPLSNVTQIGQAFLQSCSGLTSIDLSPLSKVSVVEKYFLAECTGLKSIDLSPLSQVTDLPYFFMKKCEGVKLIDLTPLLILRRLPPNLFDNYHKGLRVVLPSHLK